MIKTKQELLNHFSDINTMYNNPFMYQTLSNMIDELFEQQPCEDCISRKEALRHGRLIYDDDGKGYVVVRVDEIIDLPSVTPTRPKGKWIHWTDDYKDYVTCSCCGYGEEGEVLLNDKTPFCSICGADMRGETE